MFFIARVFALVLLTKAHATSLQQQHVNNSKTAVMGEKNRFNQAL